MSPEPKTEAALVLPEAGMSGEPVHFPGIPGVFTPGAPISVEALGFESAADARAMLEATGAPLKETKVETGSAPLPERENHVASELEARQVVAEESEAEEAAPEPRRSTPVTPPVTDGGER